MRHDPARRDFLRLVGVAVPAGMALCVCGGPGEGGVHGASPHAFLATEEMDFIQAAVARLMVKK